MGDKHAFQPGFKGNLVELLAAVRLLRRYQGTLQSGVSSSGAKLPSVTLESLRKTINLRSGILEPGVSDFTKIIVKAVFNELTKPNSKHFPGAWINSAKVSNNVKNNIGIVYKLGYECKVPNAGKVLQVIKGPVRIKPSIVEKLKKTIEAEVAPRGKIPDDHLEILVSERLPQKTNANSEIYSIDEKTSPGGITHREFRLGVSLLLPLIDPKSEKSPKDQISTDPLSVRNRNQLGFYSKNRDVVDACNLAYATKAAVANQKSKATVLGYESARGHTISLCANRTFMDATGREYQKFLDIPKNTRNFLLKLLHRNIDAEETESPIERDDSKTTCEVENITSKNQLG
jgi:hypothetical protein